MATKKRTDQVSGKHLLPRIILSEGEEGRFERWRVAAKRARLPLAEFIRVAVDAFIDKEK